MGDLLLYRDLIDACDKVVSEFANDMEDVQEVIFVIKNYGGEDKGEFPLAEHENGVNFPPLHPHCRCTTVPVTEFQIGSKRAARDPATGKTEYVEKGMTYEEWRRKYVENAADKRVGRIPQRAGRKSTENA